MSKRINVLDDMRGIAIISVMLYHYFFVYHKSELTESLSPALQYFRLSNDWLNLGVFAVSIFFLISGFVINMSLRGEGSIKETVKFAIKRFFRLYPAYWFAIVLIITSTCFYGNPDKYKLVQILVNMTMLQDFFGIEHIDGVFWTLMIEIKFYVLMAFVFLIGARNSLKGIILALIVISLVTGKYVFMYPALMFFGAIIYFDFIGKKQINLRNIVFSLVLVLVFSLVVKDDVYGAFIGKSIAFLFSIIIFLTLISWNKKLGRFLAFMGMVSYSFYLLHQVIGYLILDAISGALGWSSYLITYLIITTAAYISFRYVEKPINNYGHSLALRLFSSDK